MAPQKKTLNRLKNAEYDYIPDVESFMNQIGAKMSLLDILNEDIPQSKNDKFNFDILYYTPNDINGKSG